MRHIIAFVLLLTTLFADAEWVKGNVFLNNGEERSGYIKNFSNENTTEIEFRSKLKDTSEKFSSNDIRELQLRLKEGTLVARYLYFSEINGKGEYKTSNHKSWLRVVYRGDFDVLSFYSGSFKDNDLYINWPGEDQALMIYIWEKNAIVLSDKDMLTKKSFSTIFHQKCDLMSSSVESGLFSPTSIRDVLRFYVDNCKAIAVTVDRK